MVTIPPDCLTNGHLCILPVHDHGPNGSKHSSTCDNGGQNIGYTDPAATNLPDSTNGRATACAAERAEMPSEVDKG
jgi:hypothetical protein